LIAGWGYPKSRLPPVVYRVFPLELVTPRVASVARFLPTESFWRYSIGTNLAWQC